MVRSRSLAQFQTAIVGRLLEGAAIAVSVRGNRDTSGRHRVLAVVVVGSHGRSKVRLPVIAVLQHDHFVATGGDARHRDGGFVGFGTGVRDVRLVQIPRRDLGELLGEVHHRLGHEDGRGVLQRLQLIDRSLRDLGIAVPNAYRDDSGKHIEVLFAFFVIKELTLTLDEMRGLGEEVLQPGHHKLVAFLFQFFST
jgi:hypothetical protein